jgi:predicted nuclease of restriction endonuclease-like (RecB) superfamily
LCKGSCTNLLVPSGEVVMKNEISILLKRVREIIHHARTMAMRSVDTVQVIANFQIGRIIVEHEQKGERRAEYGKQILFALGEKLTEEFGRGFSWRNLHNMRKFFLEYRSRIGCLPTLPFGKNGKKYVSDKRSQILQKPSAKSANPFSLSWSHYVFLLAIKNPDERGFYEIEAAQGNWSLPELKRQYDSSLYERLALSRNKKQVKILSRKGQIIKKPEDLIKQPLVLEFLGLDEKTGYSESDLETAIIDKLEHFLLELGKGFLFEARQKRFTFDSDHYFVDLVFYNRLLRCYVLIDLKIGKLTHQDLGQMQMYVNYYDRHAKAQDEHPTVGIVLCKMKQGAMVELTLPKDAKIYASEYQTYLPSKEVLKRKLIEWAKEAG